MANTASELNTIHLKNLASPGKKYYSDDGKVYIGTDQKRLRLLDSASDSIFKPTDNISQKNVQEAFEVGLSNVDNTSDANKPVSGPQKTYIDSRNQLNDDNAIAYSIALGG